MNIVVIGAGTMGNGIAHLCAQHGHSVSLVDISEASLSKGIATITGNLDRQVKKEVISNDDKHAILGRINASTDLTQSAANADLIIEAATEQKNVKIALFQQAQTTAKPECIFASNTSSIGCSDQSS